MTKKDNVVPLDKDFESMLISAVRYAFGRRTYIVDSTTSYVGFLLPKLSDWCLSILNRDYTDNAALQAEIDRRLNDGNRHDFLR